MSAKKQRKYVSRVTTLAGFGARKSFQLTRGEPVEGLSQDELDMLGDNVMEVFSDDLPEMDNLEATEAVNE